MLYKTSFCPEAVIVGNGDFPTHPVPLSFIDHAAFTVCCDGAANRFIDSGRTPDCIIGDGDSLSHTYKLRFADRFIHVADQDTNDQTKAVHYLLKKGIYSAVILGATGRREDHTIGNISLLIDYLDLGMEVRMYTDCGVFIPARDNGCFECQPGCQVSVFGFGTTGMKSTGLVYPLRDFNSWWQGTLNEAQQDCFHIECSGKYLVYLNYPSL